jgi:hypothetical protein
MYIRPIVHSTDTGLFATKDYRRAETRSETHSGEVAEDAWCDIHTMAQLLGHKDRRIARLENKSN